MEFNTCDSCFYSAIQNYAERYQTGIGGFEPDAFFRALGDFIEIFSLSLTIGAVMGCITALISFVTLYFVYNIP